MTAGGGGEALGERGHVEDGVDGHGLLGGLERAHAEGLAVDDVAIVADDDYRAGELCSATAWSTRRPMLEKSS